MAQRQSVEKFGQTLQMLLAALSREMQQKQFQQDLESSTQRVPDFSGFQPSQGLPPEAPEMSVGQGTGTQRLPVNRQVDYSQLVQKSSMNPALMPFLQQQAAAKQLTMPELQFGPAGSGIFRDGKYSGRVPKEMKQDLPEGFAQIKDPETKARIWNMTYGQNLSSEVFASPDEFLQAFQGKGDKQIAVFRDREGNVYTKDIGELRERTPASNVTSKAQSAKGLIDKYFTLLKKVDTGRLSGITESGKAAIGVQPTLRTVQSLKPFIAKAFARLVDVGALSDQDAKAALDALPDQFNTREEIEMSQSTINDLLQELMTKGESLQSPSKSSNNKWDKYLVE